MLVLLTVQLQSPSTSDVQVLGDTNVVGVAVEALSKSWRVTPACGRTVLGPERVPPTFTVITDWVAPGAGTAAAVIGSAVAAAVTGAGGPVVVGGVRLRRVGGGRRGRLGGRLRRRGRGRVRRLGGRRGRRIRRGLGGGVRLCEPYQERDRQHGGAE